MNNIDDNIDKELKPLMIELIVNDMRADGIKVDKWVKDNKNNKNNIVYITIPKILNPVDKLSSSTPIAYAQDLQKKFDNLSNGERRLTVKYKVE